MTLFTEHNSTDRQMSQDMKLCYVIAMNANMQVNAAAMKRSAVPMYAGCHCSLP